MGSLLLFEKGLCLLRNSAYRAGGCTCTAADAGICIDLVLTIAHADSAYGTIGSTGTTCYTLTADNECHNDILLIVRPQPLDTNLSILYLYYNTTKVAKQALIHKNSQQLSRNIARNSSGMMHSLNRSRIPESPLPSGCSPHPAYQRLRAGKESRGPSI